MALRNDHPREFPGALVAVPDPGEPAQPYLPGWLRQAESHTVLLDKHRLRATLHYMIHPWYRVPKACIFWGFRGVRGCWYEITYVWSGGLKIIDACYGWSSAIHYENAARVALGTTHAYRGAERHANVRNCRGGLLVIAACSIILLGLWLGVYHPEWGGVAGIGLVGLFDAIGRHNRPKTEAPPHRPAPLAHGQPTSILAREIKIFLEEMGLDDSISVGAVQFAPERHAYYVSLTSYATLEPKLLRALEKRIYAPDKAIRVVTATDNAAVQTLVISTGNPLTNVPEAPWIPAGSVSGWGPLDLGLSTDPNCPYALVLVMRNVLLVSRTRGGKSVTLSTIIDRLSATSDVVICAGALIKSSIFDSWRSVLYKKAENVNQLTELLQWLIAQIKKRDQMLKTINSDDDPGNDIDKWDPSLGSAIVAVLDEFPWIAKYDGTKIHQDAKPNLLDMIETIMRTGSGLGVSLVLACQASGNEDWGSSVIYKQANVKIIGPCTERDTVDLLGKDKRDQGYSPHLLQPADEHNINDAGMAVVDGPGFGPDYVRCYYPFKVKARALRREAEWAELGNRPMLPIESHTAPVAYIDAQALPPALTAIDEALKFHNARILATELVLAHANTHGGRWTASTLSTAVRKEVPGNDKGVVIRPRNGRCDVNEKTSLKCYHREDVDQALDVLEGSS
jgi:hypothetical protein